MGQLTNPFARVGLELELLTAPRTTRLTFAERLARAVRGTVEVGFKYASEGTLPDGRPLCRLSMAARVRDRAGVFATVVDDPTLRDGLPARPARRTLHATDELRLALLIERHGWARTLEERLGPIAELFGGPLERGTLFDAVGHPVVVTLEEPAAWHRVCEVVTRPLVGARERRRALERILTVAEDLGCTVPHTAALHAHYDAAPWRSTKRLATLILRHAAERARWWTTLAPNPACTKLGPFAPQVQRVARERGRVSFPTFAAALGLAGAKKEADLNLLGVIERFPRQPTLEVRCLPMPTTPADGLASLEAAEGLLAECL